MSSPDGPEQREAERLERLQRDLEFEDLLVDYADERRDDPDTWEDDT